jgi:hypothetical protein
VPKLDPPAAAERVTQFHEALADGLKAGGLEVLPPATVRTRLNVAVEEAGCDDGRCVEFARRLFRGQRLATAKVASVGKNYTVEVRLFSSGGLVAQSSGHCDVCNHTEALQTVSRLASEAGAKMSSEAPAPVPAPTPGSVESPVRTPLPRVPAPAPAPGPAAPAVPGAALDQPAGPAPSARASWPLWPALVAGGAGVVGLAVGIPLIAIDGNGTNCNGEPRPDKLNCPDLVRTAAGGWVMTGMGIAALGASGVLLYLHLSSRPREQKRATVDRITFGPIPEGGIVVTTTGRF